MVISLSQKFLITPGHERKKSTSCPHFGGPRRPRAAAGQRGGGRGDAPRSTPAAVARAGARALRNSVAGTLLLAEQQLGPMTALARVLSGAARAGRAVLLAAGLARSTLEAGEPGRLVGATYPSAHQEHPMTAEIRACRHHIHRQLGPRSPPGCRSRTAKLALAAWRADPRRGRSADHDLGAAERRPAGQPPGTRCCSRSPRPRWRLRQRSYRPRQTCPCRRRRRGPRRRHRRRDHAHRPVLPARACGAGRRRGQALALAQLSPDLFGGSPAPAHRSVSRSVHRSGRGVSATRRGATVLSMVMVRRVRAAATSTEPSRCPLPA